MLRQLTLHTATQHKDIRQKLADPIMLHNLSRLTGGKAIAINTLSNLIGIGTPLLAAVFTIPIIIQQLGMDRFGILSLAWMLIGYFSIFDLGMGRSLTKLVADRLGGKEESDIVPLIWTASMLMAGLGAIGAIVLGCASPLLVNNLLKIPTALREEALASFMLLAASVPLVICTTGFRGILEAYQRFDLINIIRIPTGILNYVGPVLVLSSQGGLVPIILLLLAVRSVGLICYVVLCIKLVPGLAAQIAPQSRLIKPLISIGAWMTISNTVSPLMVNLDRFLIGGILSVQAVAYYATPFDLVTQLSIIPGALVGVLFPAFATSYSSQREQTVRLFRRGLTSVFVTMFFASFLVILFAPEGLTLWLGHEFASQSTTVLRILAVGIFLNSLGRVAFALVQGMGKADLTAKLHLLELPLYLPFAVVLIHHYGIAGAAVASCARIALDTGLLFLAIRSTLVEAVAGLSRSFLYLLLSLGIFAVSTIHMSLSVKILLAISVFTVTATLVWAAVLSIDERMAVKKYWVRMSQAPDATEGAVSSSSNPTSVG